MDREHLGSLLFLSSMAASAAACAGGGGPAPRPTPFVTNGSDEGDGSGETWTDPLETSGTPDSSGTDGSDGTDTWPHEGESGSPTDGTGGPPDLPPDDPGMTSMGSTSDPDPSEGSSGDYGDDSTGYDPPVGGDPCPALAQLYADCVPEYTYENEIVFCQQSRVDADANSPACGLAHSEYLACLSTLECGTLLQAGVPLPCVIQGAATDIACQP